IIYSFNTTPVPATVPFPYREAGLSHKQAAAHLISRFSFGARPGQVEEVEKMGLENWFALQLQNDQPDEQLARRLEDFTSLKMTNAEIVRNYPKRTQLLKMAVRDGRINRDSVRKGNKEAYKDELQEYMQSRQLQPQAVLFRELFSQKILRAAYSNNQLGEMMTEFWFNHFNVSLSKGGVQQFVTSFERDVLRPNGLGDFEQLLLATAKSPAMLTYLDNSKSSAAPDSAQQRKGLGGKQVIPGRKAARGLNENYAREIMELHTLGVDGGYTQSDVTEAARVLTGWGVNPQLEYNLKADSKVAKMGVQRAGLAAGEDFFFNRIRHDKGVKVVLGQQFPPNGGYEEGVALIHLLASHPSTALFVSRKLAVRFVSDAPPQSLIDKMAKTFQEKNGNIKEVLLAMVSAPEFWKKSVLRDKTKSPFELAISAVRATNAEISAPFPLYQWITKMGQKMYHYGAPTGYPDRGQYWINTGALLNRMNFGLALAANKIPGVRTNLLALNEGQEPESAEAALEIYGMRLLPERDITETIKRLIPMLSEAELSAKVGRAAEKGLVDASPRNDGQGMIQKRRQAGRGRTEDAVSKEAWDHTSFPAQVVGIIIGSPEFQRR
ncbi:MAG TPA: DUF1800 domain-containing protein, partial [Flavisolibacter sp.]